MRRSKFTLLSAADNNLGIVAHVPLPVKLLLAEFCHFNSSDELSGDLNELAPDMILYQAFVVALKTSVFIFNFL
jgi:hypothetical protein